MSSLPPISEVIDASLKIVVPAFLTTAATAIGGWKILGTRNGHLSAGLAIVLGLLAANLCRGVFVTRFDPEQPLTFQQWSRGLFDASINQPQQAPLDSEDAPTASEPDSESAVTAIKGPKSGRYWIPAAIGVAMVIELLAKSLRMPVVGLQISRIIASIVAVRLVVPADLAIEHQWLSWSVGLLVLLGWVVFSQLSARMPSWLSPTCVVVASFASATVLIHAHSARLTDAATMLMMAACGLAAAAVFFRGDTASAAPVGAIFLPAIMIAGYHETFSDVPPAAFVLPAVAPLCAGFALALPESWCRSWRGWATTILCVGLPAIASIALATRSESLSF